MKKTILFIAIICSALGTAQYEIVYKLKKGGVYPQNQTVISEQEQVINGMPQNITTTITTTSDYIVTDIKDGVYHIDIIVKQMSNESKSAMGSEAMSSDGPSSDPMNILFKNMIKDPIKITMNKHGEILSFDNAAQIAGLTEGMDMPEMQLLQIEAAMTKEISPEKQSASYEQLSKILPKKAVNEGDTWTQTTTINSIATFDTTSTYKLESVTEESFIISSSADISTPQNATTELNGVTAAYTLAGPSNATYTLDRKTGWILRAKIEQKLDGNITIGKSEMVPQEMKITMKTETTTIIE